MRFRFDMDDQRGFAFMAGLVMWLGQGVAYSLFQVPPNQLLVGSSLTLMLGPLATSTVEKYREGRAEQKRSQSQQRDSDDSDPPAESLSEEEREEREQENFKRQHGYYPMAAPS